MSAPEPRAEILTVISRALAHGLQEQANSPHRIHSTKAIDVHTMTDSEKGHEIMQSVFVLQHLHILPSGEEDVKLIGVYRSVEAARSAVERLRIQPGFQDHPRIVDPQEDADEQGFHIGTYPLDKDHWSEGYVTT